LADDAVVSSYGRGERIVHQGDPGDALYVIREGSAIVTIADGQGGEREVARLGRGEFFGEMALLTGEPRTAHVTALDDLEAIVIHKEALQGILARRPGLAHEMAEIVEARRQGLRAIAEIKALPPEKREAVRAASGELVARIRRFLGL
jgi:CRP-like cAMP-binding protein